MGVEGKPVLGGVLVSVSLITTVQPGPVDHADGRKFDWGKTSGLVNLSQRLFYGTQPWKHSRI